MVRNYFTISKNLNYKTYIYVSIYECSTTLQNISKLFHKAIAQKLIICYLNIQNNNDNKSSSSEK